jgi:CDP-glycerol glycerophosphotransferase (TagB/SpsB family)
LIDKLKKFLGIFILILYKLNPRKDVILFNSDSYRDNAKYLYEYLRDKVKGHKLVWILNDKKQVEELKAIGIDAVYSQSLRCCLVCSRLKMIITTNLPPIATIYINPIVIQVFHGFGTKQTPMEQEYNTKLKQLQRLTRNIDYIVCLSKRDSEYFFPREKLQTDHRYPEYVPLGLPRNDVLLDCEKSLFINKQVRKFFNITADKKIVLYAPTWREKPEGSTFRDYWFFNLEETGWLADYFSEHNWVMLLRPHHHCLRIKDIQDNLSEMSAKFGEVFKLAGADVWKDTQELLCASDALITDFSSIYVDYLLTLKPVVYLDMDTEEYVKHRGLVIDYHKDLHTPGPKIRSLDEILHYFEQLDAGADEYKAVRKESLKFYHDNPDGNSTERVAELVLSALNESP